MVQHGRLQAQMRSEKTTCPESRVRSPRQMLPSRMPKFLKLGTHHQSKMGTSKNNKKETSRPTLPRNKEESVRSLGQRHFMLTKAEGLLEAVRCSSNKTMSWAEKRHLYGFYRFNSGRMTNLPWKWSTNCFHDKCLWRMKSTTGPCLLNIFAHSLPH